MVGTRVIEQGDIWWADLGQPRGSVAGFRRPVVVVQANWLTQSRIDTVVCIPLTSNLKWTEVTTNLFLAAKATGFPQDSVAQPTHIQTIGKAYFIERAGRISERLLEQLFKRLDLTLSRG